MPAPVLIENSTCRANLTELSGGGCRASLADRPMRHHIQYAANLFKYAPWLTRKCLLRWGSLCAFATIGVLALNLALHSGAGLTDAAGERFGRDFFQFWSSAVLAAAGRPEAAYIVIRPCRRCLGLALFTWSLSRLVGWEMAAFAAVGTPAAFINIFLAQNGCVDPAGATADFAHFGEAARFSNCADPDVDVIGRDHAAGAGAAILCWRLHPCAVTTANCRSSRLRKKGASDGCHLRDASLLRMRSVDFISLPHPEEAQGAVSKGARGVENGVFQQPASGP